MTDLSPVPSEPLTWDVVDDALPLPGIEDCLTTPGMSPLEVAARRTLRALHDDGVLGEQHAFECQLLLDLSRGYTTSLRMSGGKVTVAMAGIVAQLQAVRAALPVREGTGDDEGDAWRDLVDRFGQAGSIPAVRDPAHPG